MSYRCSRSSILDRHNTGKVVFDGNTTTIIGGKHPGWKGWVDARLAVSVDSQLQGTLQRQLTRALTRNVNNNLRSSCLFGSESTSLLISLLLAITNHGWRRALRSIRQKVVTAIDRYIVRVVPCPGCCYRLTGKQVCHYYQVRTALCVWIPGHSSDGR